MLKKNKKTYLIKQNKVEELVSLLSKEFGLPKVSSSLGMYTEYQDKILEVTFFNSSCYLQSHDRTSNLDKKYIELFNTTPPIGIENKNIKYFLRIINDLGFSEAYVSNEVIQLEFETNNENNNLISLNLGTPIGNLVVISGDLILTCNKFIKEDFFEAELSSEKIDELFKKIKKEKIFTDNKILNDKIIQYGNKFGIDLISSGSVNMKTLLSSKSNDYSVFENYYKKISLNYKKIFFPISVVIPAYNSNDSVVHVLHSIESQDLSDKEKENIEVVVVDDGSIIPIMDTINSYLNRFSFKIKVIRLEKNTGLSSARNIGVADTIHENILFIDSDILLSKNYLLEHSNALRFYPNGIFLSMKKNIDKLSSINNIEEISKGLQIPCEFDDKRIARISKKGQDWVNKISLDGVYEILSDTSLFKTFGHGRIINGYDLPSMVVGHNMSINKSLFLKTGGFSNDFVGWGLEDAYFGARVICEGGFVIPLLDSGVYHINHVPRSGDNKEQEKEYHKNLKIYENLLNKEI